MKNQTVLVTGGTGFVAVHIILRLLQKGYYVRTTIRSLSRKNDVLKALKDGGITSFEKLSFYEADLNGQDGWEEAIKGSEYILHVASPFPAKEPDDENELIIPARDGALRVLRAARDAGVKRVVLTSSFAAIGYSIDSKDHIYTEEDWTDPEAAIPPYIKSKTAAEKAAWHFIETEGGNLELTVINPVGIFGPVLGGISSASVNVVIKGIINGMIKESPPFTMGIVDVRDVADLHIECMVHPNAKGQRFLATSEGIMSFYDVAQLIKKERPQIASNIVDMANTDTSFYISLSNQKAKSVLAWQPRTKEEAILASVDSIVID